MGTVRAWRRQDATSIEPIKKIVESNADQISQGDNPEKKLRVVIFDRPSALASDHQRRRENIRLR